MRAENFEDLILESLLPEERRLQITSAAGAGRLRSIGGALGTSGGTNEQDIAAGEAAVAALVA